MPSHHFLYRRLWWSEALQTSHILFEPMLNAAAVSYLLRRFRRRGGRGDRHVLELVGHDIDGFGETAQFRDVVVAPDGEGGGDLGGRCVRYIAVDMADEAEPRRGQRQHPAELAAAEDADP